MILFFGDAEKKIIAVQTAQELDGPALKKMNWLFNHADQIAATSIPHSFIGPRSTMITPWSTNAVEITQNMGISGIERIEAFTATKNFEGTPDPMINQKFDQLDQHIFDTEAATADIISITDVDSYNKEEGLSLSDDEVGYLQNLADRLGRPLTDSEVFGFSQVNSEHCRHKIFNGQFVIDGVEKEASLFKLIKNTSKANPNEIVSAYKDNVAFIQGPMMTQFAPTEGRGPAYYQKEKFESVISLKAETHNFPTTVEPFSGAATGSGGEIRDRMAGGKGSIPMAGTAVYMTAYSRLEEALHPWEKAFAARPWLYRTPQDILLKASNGASDFGNKFGQPLIAGSVLTFEHQERDKKIGYDKVIMQAGGVGYAKKEQALKATPSKGDKIVILGGDNYRIGMGGAAVSSADTGAVASGLELNAVQRSNPEMQKRVANTVRALVESKRNPIISIHDHGAGGHLNCLSELVEDTGGIINIDKLPIGDQTLSYKEIIGNESQERMGLVIAEEDIKILQSIAIRERAPMYVVGEVTGDHHFTFFSASTDAKPIDLDLSDFFGSSPKTIMTDQEQSLSYPPVALSDQEIYEDLNKVLRLESVACKDWLTNKVDRCVGGLVAKQQCCGPLQLPLNNVAVMALGFDGCSGIATGMGHASVPALIDPQIGSRLAIVESLNNLVWAPLEKGIRSVSLSANWMWPCKNPGEDARLYRAVEAISEYAIGLGINVPTGKDSLSMKQKYKDYEVIAPGTVIISATGHCHNINKIIEPVLKKDGAALYYISTTSHNDFHLGGSALAQTKNKIGASVADLKIPTDYVKIFNGLQKLILEGHIVAGHDVSSGGLITTLLEMCFSDNNLGADLDLTPFGESQTSRILFSENSGLVIQAKTSDIETELDKLKIRYTKLGSVNTTGVLNIKNLNTDYNFDIETYRDQWYKTSFLHDREQSGAELARARYDNYKQQALDFNFLPQFDGKIPLRPSGKRPKAAVLREQGSNSERELAHALYLAGFDVKDVHMTDLISGKETLEEIQFLGAVGGFSNSDVLGSAKGWAGSFLYNERAKKSLDQFFSRADVLSIGICNGCQLFVGLDLINPDHQLKSQMAHNDSGKHESAFTSVKIKANKSIMLEDFEGADLGVWISHGEGKFILPESKEKYNIVASYSYDAYPSNPNGSDLAAAMICSDDGRHLVTMPHIERSIFPWNWAHYPDGSTDEISPWIKAFVNARVWLEKKK